MDSKGALSVQPARQSRLVAVLAGVWLSIILVLAAWWASIIVRQSQQIAELGLATGLSNAAVNAELAGTHRMVFGELSFFLLLLLTLSGALFWFYRREILRARATQAFFAALTHELRTPLTSVRLQTEAIAEGEPNPELVERLLADTHRLESQIDKTLELARIEGGGPLREQSIPLQAWVSHSLEGIAQAHGPALDLRAHLDPGLPPIQADAGALQMILRNLVENSVRHARVNPVNVRLTAAARGSQLVLEYQDNGQGVDMGAGRLGRLFGRGPSSSGAGVGLYLVRRLMQRMGGNAKFNTAPGEGFRAELWFPVST
jgi:signal transduction histidine kinase